MPEKKKDEKPAEVKPEETKPVETAAPEAPKATEEKPAEPVKEEAKPTEEKPAEPSPAAPTKEAASKETPPVESGPKIVKKEVPPTPEEVAKALNDQILQARHADYWVIRIKKQTLLVFIGVAILTLWLMPFIQKLPELAKGYAAGYSLIPKPPFIVQKGSSLIATPTPEPTATPTPSPESTTSAKIRVRYIPANSEQAKLLSDTLAQAGYGSADLAEDKQITEKTNSIVVKPDGAELRAKLQTLLKESYNLATSSALLAADSDFDALILLGKTK